MSKFLFRLICIALVLTLSFPELAFARRKSRPRQVRSSANAAILMDFDHNRRLFGKNVDRAVFPASTTKVLTAMLVLEKLSLDQYVVVNASATKVQPTKLNLRQGEQYKVRDLLYAVLLKSANDAANVLAEAVAGSQEKFVEMMNQKAVAIGARHSRFANAHGLPSQARQSTTAYDMALIFRQALKNPFFKSAITYKYCVIYSKDGRRIVLRSHNKSLFLNWKQKVYGKTGYTREAGPCFVGFVPRGKDILVVAVFGSQRRWDYIKLIIEKHGKVDL